MVAQIINGKEISREIRGELRGEVESLKENGRQPGLATILVGDNADSKIYVGLKHKACNSLGIYAEQQELPHNTTESELLELIERLNNDDRISGILCQLPLPEHINTDKILLAISPEKDVDGFHPLNIGKLINNRDCGWKETSSAFLPCTPKGIMELIHRSNTKINSSEAVVVGRDNYVGKPVAMLLMAENADVTLCDLETENIGEITKRADILIVGVRRPKFITCDMVKEGAVVIDTEVNRTDDGLVGDVDFERVKEKAGAITPVPGGVGPMIITMLMANTVKAAKQNR